MFCMNPERFAKPHTLRLPARDNLEARKTSFVYRSRLQLLSVIRNELRNRRHAERCRIRDCRDLRRTFQQIHSWIAPVPAMPHLIRTNNNRINTKAFRRVLPLNEVIWCSSNILSKKLFCASHTKPWAYIAEGKKRTNPELHPLSPAPIPIVPLQQRIIYIKPPVNNNNLMPQLLQCGLQCPALQHSTVVEL